MPLHSVTLQRGSRFSASSGGNRYRRNQKRSVCLPWNKVGRCFSVGVYTFVGISFFMACSLGLLAAYRWMTQSELFMLQNVQVHGVSFLDYDDVVAAAGLQAGQNTLDIRMQELEARLRANPWVQSVTLKRSLPDTLVITVQEREPRFWVQQGEKLYFADAAGEVIAPVASSAFKALPLLRLEEGAGEQLEVFHKFSTRARALHAAFDPRQAAWVHVGRDQSIELYIESRDLLVTLDARNWELNLDCLRRAWKDLVQRKEHDSVRAMSAHGAKVWVTKGPKKGTAA